MRIVFESPMVVDVPFFDDGNFVGRFADVKTIAWPFGDVGGDFINLRLLILLLLLTISTGGSTRFRSDDGIIEAGEHLDDVVGVVLRSLLIIGMRDGRLMGDSI